MTIQSMWSRTAKLGLVTSLLLSSALPAHANSTSTEAPGETSPQFVDDGSYTFSASIPPSAMAKEDLALYRADWEYVRSLMASGESITLNHADDRQHRFVMTRLKLAGKTPENSPALFKQIANARTEHHSKGYQAGTTVQSLAGTQRKKQHYFPSLSFLSPQQMEVLATGSSPDALFYGSVDVMVTDVDGTLLGPMNFREVYGNMPYLTASTVGDLSLTNNLNYRADSLLIEDTVNFGYRATLSEAANNRKGPQIGKVTITGPKNSVADECISVCLNRTWTGDCDYDLTGTQWAFKIPLSGSVSLSTPNYIFNMTQILAYKAGTAPGGQIRVVLADVGGGCDVDSNNALFLPMQQFWNSVTISLDGRTMSWNMTGANAALFDSSCRQVQDSVELAMNISLPWIQTTSAQSGTSPLFLTNNPGKGTPDFPCINVTNSCLAAGTVIQLADGRGAPIESIQTGDQVFNPFEKTRTSLTVADTAKGIETVPMVRIKDEKGRSLLMTEMHPIQVVKRGMVTAKHLKAGDMVLTQSGPSRLVRVTREKFDGTVHNLKVGTDVETRSLGTDQTVVYANGFLVGDGQIQSKYESLELSANKRQGSPLKRLPPSWHRDYMNSASARR